MSRLLFLRATNIICPIVKRNCSNIISIKHLIKKVSSLDREIKYIKRDIQILKMDLNIQGNKIEHIYKSRIDRLEKDVYNIKLKNFSS